VAGLIAVLHGIHYPEWMAGVHETEIRSRGTNLFSRGNGMPAGHHRVEFSFDFSILGL
jgi:hypothetical protein